jgi:hypothetical protein
MMKCCKIGSKVLAVQLCGIFPIFSNYLANIFCEPAPFKDFKVISDLSLGLYASKKLSHPSNLLKLMVDTYFIVLLILYNIFFIVMPYIQYIVFTAAYLIVLFIRNVTSYLLILLKVIG